MKELFCLICSLSFMTSSAMATSSEDETMLMFVGEVCHITLVNGTRDQAVIEYVIFDDAGKSVSSGWLRTYSKKQYLNTTSSFSIKYRIFYPAKPPLTENWKYHKDHCGSKIFLQ